MSSNLTNIQIHDTLYFSSKLFTQNVGKERGNLVLLQCIGRTRIGCWALLLQRSATIKTSNNKHVYLYSLSLWLDMGSSRKRAKVLLLPLCNARSKFPECYFFPSFTICIFRLSKNGFTFPTIIYAISNSPVFLRFPCAKI